MSRNQATVVATGTTSRRQSNATKQRNILSETGGETERERKARVETYRLYSPRFVSRQLTDL